MFRKNVIRLLIFAVLLASCFIMVLSINAIPHATKLNISADSEVGPAPWLAFWDSKTHASAEIWYSHFYSGHITGQHWHRFSYSLYARVANKVVKNPMNGGYGNISVGSLTRFFPSKQISISTSDHERWENDAYASASVSDNGDPTNWDFSSSP